MMFLFVNYVEGNFKISGKKITCFSYSVVRRRIHTLEIIFHDYSIYIIYLASNFFSSCEYHQTDLNLDKCSVS